LCSAQIPRDQHWNWKPTTGEQVSMEEISKSFIELLEIFLSNKWYKKSVQQITYSNEALGWHWSIVFEGSYP